MYVERKEAEDKRAAAEQDVRMKQLEIEEKKLMFEKDDFSIKKIRRLKSWSCRKRS